MCQMVQGLQISVSQRSPFVVALHPKGLNTPSSCQGIAWVVPYYESFVVVEWSHTWPCGPEGPSLSPVVRCLGVVVHIDYVPFRGLPFPAGRQIGGCAILCEWCRGMHGGGLTCNSVLEISASVLCGLCLVASPASVSFH